MGRHRGRTAIAAARAAGRPAARPGVARRPVRGCRGAHAWRCRGDRPDAPTEASGIMDEGEDAHAGQALYATGRIVRCRDRPRRWRSAIDADGQHRPGRRSRRPTSGRRLTSSRPRSGSPTRTGKFVPDLKMDEFQVFEDGVPQKITAFVRAIGGRIINDVAPSVGAVSEGLILPPPGRRHRLVRPHLHHLHRRPASAGARLAAGAQRARADSRHDHPRQRSGRPRLDRLLVD